MVKVQEGFKILKNVYCRKLRKIQNIEDKRNSGQDILMSMILNRFSHPLPAITHGWLHSGKKLIVVKLNYVNRVNHSRSCFIVKSD